MSDWFVIFRWWLTVLFDRARNRALDLAGRLGGYCMETCWQPDARTFRPGDAAVRCWRRRGHRTATHACTRGATVLLWESLGAPRVERDRVATLFFPAAPGWARHSVIPPSAHQRAIHDHAARMLRERLGKDGE